MRQTTYLQTVSVIFAAVAIVHALRLIDGWQLEIGGWIAPMWLSWVGLIVGAYLAYQGLKLKDKK